MLRIMRVGKRRFWKRLALAIIALVVAPNVYAEVEVPDLTISSIGFSGIPTIGYPLGIYVDVKNIGGTDLLTREFYVSFRYKKASIDWSYHIEDVLVESIPSGEVRHISIEWMPPSPGDYSIFVKADCGGSIDEADEENNVLTQSINVRAPDLTLSPSDITFLPPYPKVGQVSRIGATIHNIGNLEASNISTEFWIHGIYIEGPTIKKIEPGGNRTISKIWTFTRAQLHNIRVYADATTAITESNEENNWADTTILVLYPGQEPPSEEVLEEEGAPPEKPGLRKRIKERMKRIKERIKIKPLR